MTTLRDLKPMTERRQAVNPHDRALLAAACIGAAIASPVAAWVTLMIVRASGG